MNSMIVFLGTEALQICGHCHSGLRSQQKSTYVRPPAPRPLATLARSRTLP